MICNFNIIIVWCTDQNSTPLKDKINITLVIN